MVTWFLIVFGNEGTEILPNSLFTFLLSKARQAKMEHMEMKISQHTYFWYFGSFDKKRSYENICNELGIRYVNEILLFQAHIQVNDFCL